MEHSGPRPPDESPPNAPPDGPAFLPLRTRPLAVLTAELGPPRRLGARKVVPVTGGTLRGPRLDARLLPMGGDWAWERADGVLTLDVRLTAETRDGALILVTYTGLRHGPPEVMDRLARGAPVDPTEMYFRIQPSFETADPRYAWLTRLLAVGLGERLPQGPRYSLHEVL